MKRGLRNKQMIGGGEEDRVHRTLGGKSQGKISSERQRFQRKNNNIKAFVSETDVSVN